MQISVADYRALRNAQAERGNSEANIYAQRANEVKSITSSIQSLAKTAASVVDKVKTEQTKLQETEKSRYSPTYDTDMQDLSNLLQNSLNTKTSYYDSETNQAVIDSTVTDKIQSMKDDVNAQTNLSKKTKQYFIDQIDAYANSLNSKVELASHLIDIQSDSTDLNNKLDTGYKQWVSTGDRSYLTNVYDQFNLSEGLRKSYDSAFDAQYQTDSFKNTIYQTSQTKGYAAAAELINNNTSLSVDEKSDLLTQSSKWASQQGTAITQQTTEYAKQQFASGSSVQTVLTNVIQDAKSKGYSEDYTQKAIDGVTVAQTAQMSQLTAPYEEKLDYASFTEVEEMKQMLTENKNMFMGVKVQSTDANGKTTEKTVGGIESTYNALMKKIETREAAFDPSSKANIELLKTKATEVKANADIIYQEWESGKLGGEDSINSLYQLANDAGGNAFAVDECNNFVLKIMSNGVPTVYSDQVETFYKDLDKEWLSTMGAKDFQALTDEQKEQYMQMKARAQGAMIDLFKDNGNLSSDQIIKREQEIRQAFIGDYLKFKTNITQDEQMPNGRPLSVLEMAQTLRVDNPLYFDQDAPSGEGIVWLSDNAQKQFENVSLDYAGKLTAMGIEIDKKKSFEPYQEGRSVEAIPVLTSTDGKRYIVVDEDTTDSKTGNSFKKGDVVQLVQAKQTDADGKERKVTMLLPVYINKTLESWATGEPEKGKIKANIIQFSDDTYENTTRRNWREAYKDYN